MDMIQGCYENVDNNIYTGNRADTDKHTTIRDYVCYSSSSWQDSPLKATSVVTSSYNKDTSSYHGIVSYDENNCDIAMKARDVACSSKDRNLAISFQDEDLPDLPLDLSVSSISKSSGSSVSTCLQTETYSDIGQCPQSAKQSPVASSDLTSLSSSAAAATSAAAAAAATAVVELNASIIRNASMSSISSCLPKEINGATNQCRQSANQSPVAPHDLTAAAAAAATTTTTTTTAAAATTTAAALDLSVSSVCYLSSIPMRLQTETHSGSGQCPQSTTQSPIWPSELVVSEDLCYLCGNQLCLSDKSEIHICSKKLVFSSPNPSDFQTVYGNTTSPQSTDDSFGLRTRKRSASPESEDELRSRMPYVSEPDVKQVTSSLFPITSSMENITSSVSPTSSSGFPIKNKSLLHTIIRTTLPTNRSLLHNPRKKLVTSSEKDDRISGQCLKDCSNTNIAFLNKCNNARNKAPSTQASAQEDTETISGARKLQLSIPVSKKPKTVRRLNFGFDTRSPVSGTIIKQAEDLNPEDGIIVCSDIDPYCNVVEVTAEAKAELQKIQNIIGDYICQLCNAFYEDAFKLAQHRCSKIVHIEYKCVHCEKVFNCPANLASHSRWHKPSSNGTKERKANGLTRNPASTQRQSFRVEMMGATVCKKDSPGKMVLAAKSVSSRFIDDESHDSQHSKYLLPVTNAYINVDHNKNDRYIPTNTELATKTFNLNGVIHTKSVYQKESVSEIVKYKQAQTYPLEDLHENIRVASNKSISKSSSGHCLNSEQSTNPEYNILHTSYGSYHSRLTPEEKSLVRECLDSHNLQPQITSLSKANNEITHSLTDSFSNSNDAGDGTISQNSNNSCYTRMEDCKYDVTSEGTGTDTFSKTMFIPSYQRPADYTRSHEGKLDFHKIGKFQNPTALSERQGNQQNECSVCGKRFHLHSYLRKHIQLHHKTENITLSSEKTTSTDNNVFRDLEGNTSCESDQYGCKATRLFCSNCDKIFTTQAAKLKHDAVMHGLRSLLSCNDCAMTFTSKAAVDKHVRGAHKVNIFSCKHCPSRFHSSPSLTRHINKCHPTENRQVILLQLTSVHNR